METIVTKKDEIISSITLPSELAKAVGMYINKTVKKSWIEDFIDEDTGEVIPIERNEVLYDKGTTITPELTAKILFYMQAGDIGEIEISNQRRAAYEACYGARIYLIVAEVGPKMKKNKFLFQAPSIPVALEIIRDYIELNFIGGYRIISVKEFQTDIVLEDKLKSGGDYMPEEGTLDDDKFYQITFLVGDEDGYEHKANAVVKTTELDKAIMTFEKWIHEQQPGVELTIKLEEAKLLTVDFIVEDEFLLAYKQN